MVFLIHDEFFLILLSFLFNFVVIFDFVFILNFWTLFLFFYFIFFIFTCFVFILIYLFNFSLLPLWAPYYLILMSKRIYLIKKCCFWKVIVTQNTSAFLYPILTYQIKSLLHPPGYYILKNFLTPDPFIKFLKNFLIPRPPVFSNPRSYYAPSIMHSRLRREKWNYICWSELHCFSGSGDTSLYRSVLYLELLIVWKYTKTENGAQITFMGTRCLMKSRLPTCARFGN